MKKILLFLFACFAKMGFLTAQTITLVSAPATINQTICVNTALNNIVYNTSNGVTGATVTGLPAGITGTYSGGTNGMFIISGTGTAVGTFSYAVTATGSGTPVTITGSITVVSNVTLTFISAPGTNSQTVAINTPIINIGYVAANGATGVTVTGLPPGVTGTHSSGVFTISGTPSVAGTFNYTVVTSGGCNTVLLTGTITVNAVGPSLILISGMASQSVCINTAVTNITYSSSGGVTNATITNLPPGVSGNYSGGTNGTVTIAGIPTAAGTYTYSVTTSGGGTPSTVAGTIIVNANTTVNLNSGTGTTNQTIFANSPITPITYTINGAGGAMVNGLPAGITGTFTGTTLTISGTPTATGSFNYTVVPTGGCGNANATGTINVNPGSAIMLSSAPNTVAQTVCTNSLIINITYGTLGGVTNAIVTGLPPGVSGSYSGGTNGTVTISGMPVAAGIYNYIVTATGGSGPVTATGSIIVVSATTITFTSGAGTNNQTVAISTPITNISYTINGGVSNVMVSGLPSGVTGNFVGTTLLISGTPTATGIFNYTITPLGGCGSVTAMGTITVNPGPFIILSSAPGSNNQSICSGASIMPITYATGGGVTNATVTGLPAGVTGVYSGGIFTITGTPAVTGTFTYTVTTSGGSGSVFVTGAIIVSLTAAAVTLTSAPGTNSQTVCVNTAITPIIYSTSNGATGATVTGLPPGITGTYSGGTNGTLIISGTGTTDGTYNYTVTTTGSCSTATVSGTITVKPNLTLTLVSGSNTNNQTVCINTAITNIVYAAANGVTGATVSGLPAGVTGTYAGGMNGVFTISGTPSTSGVFNYTVVTTGGCGNTVVTGIISVLPCTSPLVASPNPTNGPAHLFFYSSTSNARPATVSVYNSRGIRVMMKQMTLIGRSGTIEIDMGINPADIYLVILRDADGRKIGESRLIKF